VALFDLIYGQRGVAPNSELHPVAVALDDVVIHRERVLEALLQGDLEVCQPVGIARRATAERAWIWVARGPNLECSITTMIPDTNTRPAAAGGVSGVGVLRTRPQPLTGPSRNRSSM